MSAAPRDVAALRLLLALVLEAPEVEALCAARRGGCEDLWPAQRIELLVEWSARDGSLWRAVQAEIERRLGPWLAASSGRPLVAGLAELRAADVPAHAALLWTLVTRGEALAPLTARVAAELELKVAASAWSERGAQRSGSIAAP